MMYENNFYRTSDGTLDIEFLFVDLGPADGWRAYILTEINYKRYSWSRSDSCSDIHRLIEFNESRIKKIRHFLQDTRDETPESIIQKIRRLFQGAKRSENKTIYYICWTEKIDNLDKMKNIAKAWSEITAYYIRNGGSFKKIQETLSARGII